MRDEQDPTVDDGSAFDDALPFDEEPAAEPGRRRGRKRRNVPGCIAVLVALAIVVGGFYFVVTWGMGALRDQFDSADDYPGPGHGKVSFEVHEGDTVAQMGRNLKSAGVVASVEAFTSAAAANEDSTRIQVGFYPLKKEMAADDVVEILVDPGSMVKDTVTIPEGLRAEDTIAILAKKTKFSVGRLPEGDRQAQGSACPTTPTAVSRAISSRRPTASARRQRRPRCSRRWSTGGARPPTTPTWRALPPTSATRRAN